MHIDSGVYVFINSWDMCLLVREYIVFINLWVYVYIDSWVYVFINSYVFISSWVYYFH